MTALVSGGRDYIALMEDRLVRRDTWAVLLPGKLITSWSRYSGNAYQTPLYFRHDGRNLDILEVRSLLDAGLTRVESIADVVSTAGSYYYDPDVTTSTVRWGDGVTKWGDGVTKWGQFPFLYLHLEDGSDPRLTKVIAAFGLYVGTRGAVHPCLGPDKLSGQGGFESWSAGVPVGWTFANSGSYSVAELTADPRHGSKAARITGSGVTYGELHRTPATVSGARYRLSGAYRLSVMSGASAKLLVGATSDFLYDDGRNHDASGEVALAASAGEWRRFSFDFLAFGATTLIKLRLACDSGVNATLDLDDVKLQRIYRYEYFEPRLTASGVQAFAAGKNDIFFGGQRIGSGAIEVLNGDAWLGIAGSDLDWAGRRAQVFVSGAFSSSEEIPRENWRQTFEGSNRAAAATDVALSLQLEDVRGLIHRKLPPNAYNTQYGFPQLDPAAEGARRPLFFGTKTNIPPIRVDKSGDYGIYELADCSFWSSGIKAVDAVYAYTDKESADQKLSDRRITLVAGTDYSADLANGRITILRDVGPFQILAGVDVLDRQRLGAVRGNDRLDFSDGSTRVASLTPGLYTGAGLATHIQTQMNAVSSGWTVTYSETTHKFTISRSSGTAQLLLSTGANKDRTVFATLGFTGSADTPNQLTHTADEAVYTDPEANHVIRCNAKGYKDDASGTYTGSANALIEKGPDIVRFIWRRFMGQPLSKVDSTTFAAARTTAPEALGIWIYVGGGSDDNRPSTKDILDRIEISCLADIVIDGDGTIYFDPYSNDAPASNAPHIRDFDFLELPTEGRDVVDVYASIRIRYDQDPSSGIFRERTADVAEAEIRFQRPDPRDFETYLVNSEDAQARANDCATLTKANPIRLQASCLGLLTSSRPGQKIRVTRSRSTFNTDRAYTSTVFRILELEHDAPSGRMGARLVKDVTL